MRLQCRKEINVMRHVCLRNPCLLRKSKPSTAYQKLEVPESCSMLHQFCITLHANYACIMPIPSLQLQKIDPSHAEIQRVWITDYWLWSRLFYTATAASQWRIAEIELLATLWVGSRAASQPFSWRCWQNVMHCRKEIYAYLCDMFV